MDILREVNENLCTSGILQSPDCQPQDKISLIDVINKLRLTEENPFIIDQIKSDGLGSELVSEANGSEGLVFAMNLITWMYVQRAGVEFMEMLAGQFGKVELLEQVSDYYKFRVPKEDKTIGYLFGEIEEKKEEYKIQEYGISQTSLEQIFQTFANQAIDSSKAFMTF